MKAGTVEISRGTLRLADVLELAKPRIVVMVLVTTAAGAVLASPVPVSPPLIVSTLVATALLASAASALNQVLEYSDDARMSRTARRPVAAGRVDRSVVLSAAAATIAVALLLLVWEGNRLTATLGAITVFSYLFLYTPLKKYTPLATLVGAVPGALPPVMGWSAVAENLDAGAWLLFGIVFLWQIPHFLAIAWMHRSDYERAGFAVLPVFDPRGRWTAGAMALFASLLMIWTFLVPSQGFGGTATLVTAAGTGAVFLAACLVFARKRSYRAARGVLLASVIYLPIFLGVLMLDHSMGG